MYIYISVGYGHSLSIFDGWIGGWDSVGKEREFCFSHILQKIALMFANDHSFLLKVRLPQIFERFKCDTFINAHTFVHVSMNVRIHV